MLSTLSCCASACHCSVPAVSWLICCVTTYLLGRIAMQGRYYSSYPARAIRKRSWRARRWPCRRRFAGFVRIPGARGKVPGPSVLRLGFDRVEGRTMDLAVRKMTLGRFGVEDVGAVHENLPPARLVEASVRRREGMISGSGALVVRTGKRTGRSPKDRFIIENDVTRDAVDWGTGNKAFPERRLRGAPRQGRRLRREPGGDLRGRRLRRRRPPLPPQRPRGDRARLAGPVRAPALQASLQGGDRCLRARLDRDLGPRAPYRPRGGRHGVRDLRRDRLRAQGGPRLRHGLRRGDQEEHLHGAQLRVADRTRRLPDALLGQRGKEGRRGAVLRALGDGQDDPLGRPGAGPDR